MNVSKTSDMQYPLESPIGWHLHKAQHEHEQVSDKLYTPRQDVHGAWSVEFRRNAYENEKSNVAFGRGHTLYDAWKMGLDKVAIIDG